MKKIYTLILLFVFIGCEDEKPQLRDRDISGTFELFLAKRFEHTRDENGYTNSKVEYIDTGCDKKNLLQMNSDGTFTQWEFSGPECDSDVTRKGTWIYIRTSYGTFKGELKFHNSPIMYDTFQISGNGNDTHIKHFNLTAGNTAADVQNDTTIIYTYYYQIAND